MRIVGVRFGKIISMLENFHGMFRIWQILIICNPSGLLGPLKWLIRIEGGISLSGAFDMLLQRRLKNVIFRIVSQPYLFKHFNMMSYKDQYKHWIVEPFAKQPPSRILISAIFRKALADRQHSDSRNTKPPEQRRSPMQHMFFHHRSLTG
jgi:hypothetical protein